MNRFILIAWLTGFLLINIVAQESQVNELKLKLQTASPKEKVSLFLKLSDLTEKYNEKVGYCERALNIANELKDVELQANANFALGMYHYSEGKYMYADKSLLEALEHFKKRNDTKSVAKTYFWLAMSNKYRGKYQNATKFAQLGLDLNKRLKSKEEIIETLVTLGNIYLAQGDRKQAEINFNSALKEIGNKEETTGFGFASLGKGIVCFEYGKLDSAKLLFDQANKIFVKLNNRFGEASSLKELARYYITKKDTKKAESSIDHSIKLLKAINNKPVLFDTYLLKGEMYYMKKNYARAIELYQAGLKLALEMQLQKGLVNNYKSIANAYEAKKDISKALKYYKLYSSAKDSVLLSEANEQLLEMQTKYETEKQGKDNLLDNKGINVSQSKQKYVIVLLGVLGLALAIVSALLYHKGQEKEKNSSQIIGQQKEELESSKNQISSVIDYATRIQGALLPDTSIFKPIIKGHFILNKPRDIVGGDFYWTRQIDNKLVVVAADSTGNGIAGAFMSVLGISLLNNLVSNKKNIDAAEILEELRKSVKSSLNQEILDDNAKDGIEMAICILNTDTLQLQFAGANLPLYLIRKGNLEIFKGTNNPIGLYLREKSFENRQIQLQSGDNIYLFTNGYMDQFGGKNGRKFKVSHFRDALLAISGTDMNAQKKILENIFDEWKNSKYEQTDDVLVMGLRV